jgi:hypothetical protein
MSRTFDPEWLDLCEGFDAAARNVALAARLAAILPARPRILDLGADSGSMLRWLAPSLGRAQAWLLVSPDAAPLMAAFERTAEWAERHGWTVTWPSRAMLIHAPDGAWRVEGLVAGPDADPAGLPFDRVDAVLCSRWLQSVPRFVLDRLVAALRTPFLASLVANGRNDWLPRHAADRLIDIGLRRACATGQGYGATLGVHALPAAVRALRGRGFTVMSGPSDWRIPAGVLAMTRKLVQDAADAARAALPLHRRVIAEWEQVRLRQSLAARLAVHVGQRDILAVPSEG